VSGIDYEELIRSPLDDLYPGPSSPWAAMLGGLIAGLIVGYLVIVLIGGYGGTPTTVASSVETSTSIVPAETVAPDYPAGYLEFAPDVAARPEVLYVEDNTVTVAFTSVVSRGSDPATIPWPHGGSWLLQTDSGATLRSSQVVFGAYSPGSFSVIFPAADLGPAEFGTIRMLDRWDAERYAGSASIPFEGEPFELTDPLSIPVNQDVTLLVPLLQLGRFSGLAEWQIYGAQMGAAVDMTAVLVDDADEEVGVYAAPTEIIDPGNEGVLDFNWQRSFPNDQEGATAVDLQYTVDVIEVTAADVTFLLDDVPVAR
jgi:hypothetical protein